MAVQFYVLSSVCLNVLLLKCVQELSSARRWENAQVWQNYIVQNRADGQGETHCESHPHHGRPHQHSMRLYWFILHTVYNQQLLTRRDKDVNA